MPTQPVAALPAPLPESRSDRTRARILGAARTLFAEEGYERATIRAVAAAAAVDPALVLRYFGSKDGLFATAVQFDLRMPDLTATRDAAVGTALVRHFLNRWEGDPGDDTLRILLRASASTPLAAARTREVFATQIMPLVERFSRGAQSETRAGLMATQMIGLAYCRYILELPPVAALAPDAIVAWLGPTMQRYLTDPLPEAGPR